MVDSSFIRLLLAAAVVSTVLVPGSYAQESAVVVPDSQPIPLDRPISSSQRATDNQGDPIFISLAKSLPGFEVSASLLLLQPQSGNLVYGAKVTPFPFVAPHWEDQSINPDFSPAFNIGVRYDFGCGADTQLSWTSLNTHDSASALGNPTLTVVPGQGAFFLQAVGPPFLIGPPPPFTYATGIAHSDFDSVTWDAGLTLSAGSHVRMRFFAGLEGARVSQSLSGDFVSPASVIAFNDTSKSIFTGIGPRLGLDMNCSCGQFDFLLGMAGAMLLGGTQSRMDFTTNSPTVMQNGLAINPQSLTSQDGTRVVPSIDAKLGCSYTTPVGRFGVLKCELGYQAAAYFNAVTQYSLTEVSDSATFPNETDAFSGVFLRTAVEQQTNFFVHGPYLKFALDF